MARYSRAIHHSTFYFLNPFLPLHFRSRFPIQTNLRSFSQSHFAPSHSVYLSAILPSHRESDFKYDWIDGAESLEKYEPGDYHPIMIGDTLQGRYQIVDKLGFGGYSTVWLAHDLRVQKYVAGKVGIADSPDRDSLRRELKALQALSTPPSSQYVQQHRGSRLLPLVLDEFEVHGPNGAHPCYTTPPARCNLRDVSYSRLFHLDVARVLAGGLALAVAHTHSKGYAHGGLSF
jgi:hypothetical protein